MLPLFVTFLSLQEFPVVTRLLLPSVRCPICCHASDKDFRNCQRCGYKRKVICPTRVGQIGVNLDLSQIDKWLQELLNYDQATSYSRQKDSLQKQLEAFLSALPGQVTLATVTPRGFCRSLIFKDKDGKRRLTVIAVSSLGNKWTSLWLLSTIVIQNCGFLYWEIKVYFPH